eukprot:3607943-Prymnesium_polylepis.1
MVKGFLRSPESMCNVAGAEACYGSQWWNNNASKPPRGVCGRAYRNAHPWIDPRTKRWAWIDPAGIDP